MGGILSIGELHWKKPLKYGLIPNKIRGKTSKTLDITELKFKNRDHMLLMFLKYLLKFQCLTLII